MTQPSMLATPICADRLRLSYKQECICRLTPNHQGDHQCGICAGKWSENDE